MHKINGYLLTESIINLVNEFKQILKSKNVEKLKEWIEKANNHLVQFRG
jgi:predicted ThiF/HesA family dinucleotide-utilizing enzyme